MENGKETLDLLSWVISGQSSFCTVPTWAQNDKSCPIK